MNVEKSKLKMLTTQALGKDLEDQRDKAERSIYRHQGAASALNTAEKRFNALTQKVRDEIINGEKEGKLPYDPTNAIEVGRYVVDSLMKGAKLLHELADAATASAVRHEGVKLGLDQAVGHVHASFDEEKNKVEQWAAAIEAGIIKKDGNDYVYVGDADDPRAPRPPGTHPGPPMKAVRQSDVKSTKKGNGKTGPAKPVKKKAPKKKAAPKKKPSAKKADAKNA